MNIGAFAPRSTIFTLTDTNPTEVVSGATIRVWGVSVTELSGAAKTVTFRSADASVTYLTIAVAANATVANTVKWIADKGLEAVASAGNASVTIFHSNPGA